MPSDELKKVNTGDRDLDTFSVAVADAVNPVLKVPMLRGRQVDVQLTASQAIVEHKLGRAPIGWILMSVDNDTRLWEDRTATPDRSKFIVIRTSAAAVNFSLWVF